MLQDNRVVKSYFRQFHDNSLGINTPQHQHRLSELCSQEIMGAYYHTGLRLVYFNLVKGTFPMQSVGTKSLWDNPYDLSLVKLVCSL